MPLLEIVNAEMLKKYPYFWNWIQELGRKPEDVADFVVASHIKEVPSDTQFKVIEPIDTFTATLTFTDGATFDRDGKWSDGTMMYRPDEVSA